MGTLRRIPGVILTLLIASGITVAQRRQIDSLRSVLPAIKGPDRVSLLNILSTVFVYLDADTALSYQRKAYSEARRIGDRRGEAQSLNALARLYGYSDRDFAAQETTAGRVAREFPDLTGSDVLTDAAMNIALARFSQSHFEETLAMCDTLISWAGAVDTRRRRGEAVALKGAVHYEQGKYPETLDAYEESLRIFSATGDDHNAAIILAKIGDLYRMAGDQAAALRYYEEALSFRKTVALTWHPLDDLGDAFYVPDVPVDDPRYAQAIKLLSVHRDNHLFRTIQLAEGYITDHHYIKGIAILRHELAAAMARRDQNYAMRLLFDLAHANEQIEQYPDAFLYAHDLRRMASSSRAKHYQRDAFQILYSLHDKKGRVDSAYYFHRLKTMMADSIALMAFSKQVAIRSAMAETATTKFRLESVSNEKEIANQRLRLREQDLQSESRLRQVMMYAAVLLALLGLFLYRNIHLQRRNAHQIHQLKDQQLSLQRMESERTNEMFQKRAVELEMQALRAQMSPHFIFNALNAINRYILTRDSHQASEYLAKFAKLIRMVLHNSQQSLIALDTELDTLKLYLELEAVRFNCHFDYHLRLQNELETSAIKVPPLLLQPYVENAIWHGLMHKVERGNLWIDLWEQDGQLCCKVVDDGIGLRESARLNQDARPGHQSIGTNVSSARIALLQQQRAVEATVSVREILFADGEAGGTEVLIKIPLLHD